jgi:hypothetical protein
MERGVASWGDQEETPAMEMGAGESYAREFQRRTAEGGDGHRRPGEEEQGRGWPGRTTTRFVGIQGWQLEISKQGAAMRVEDRNARRKIRERSRLT